MSNFDAFSRPTDFAPPKGTPKIITGYDISALVKVLRNNGYAVHDLTDKHGCVWALSLRIQSVDQRFFDDRE